MTYNWNEHFSLADALNGMLVGFPVTSKPYDLSNTGTLVGPGPIYTLKFGGYTLKVLENGTVNKVTPVNDDWLGQTLYMVTAVMGSDGAVGDRISRAAGTPGASDAIAVLNNIEPRDQFAVQALNAMLIHTDHPETFDDAKCLMYSRAAYRWAQAMMIAAADSREGQSAAPSTGVTVDTGDLQSNTEKLLFNIGEYMKDGIAIKGSTLLGASPVKTKVSGLESITEAYDIPTIVDSSNNPVTINIQVSIFKQKYIRFEVPTYMVYSNLSILLELDAKEGTTQVRRKVSFILPKGSVVYIAELNPVDAITEITSINSKVIKGQGGNDHNTYALVNPPS